MSPPAEAVYVPPKNMGLGGAVRNELPTHPAPNPHQPYPELTPVSRSGPRNANVPFSQGPKAGEVQPRPKSRSVASRTERICSEHGDTV